MINYSHTGNIRNSDRRSTACLLNSQFLAKLGATPVRKELKYDHHFPESSSNLAALIIKQQQAYLLEEQRKRETVIEVSVGMGNLGDDEDCSKLVADGLNMSSASPPNNTAEGEKSTTAVSAQSSSSKVVPENSVNNSTYWKLLGGPLISSTGNSTAGAATSASTALLEAKSVDLWPNRKRSRGVSSVSTSNYIANSNPAVVSASSSSSSSSDEKSAALRQMSVPTEEEEHDDPIKCTTTINKSTSDIIMLTKSEDSLAQEEKALDDGGVAIMPHDEDAVVENQSPERIDNNSKTDSCPSSADTVMMETSNTHTVFTQYYYYDYSNEKRLSINESLASAIVSGGKLRHLKEATHCKQSKK